MVRYGIVPEYNTIRCSGKVWPRLSNEMVLYCTDNTHDPFIEGSIEVSLRSWGNCRFFCTLRYLMGSMACQWSMGGVRHTERHQAPCLAVSNLHSVFSMVPLTNQDLELY